MVNRSRLTVQGAVQGVGFRPFVYRLAIELRLGGWVINSPQGAVIEVESTPEVLDVFSARLQSELPAHATIYSLDAQSIQPIGEHAFAIKPSNHNGAKTALILPDLATCPDCLREVNDPADRHYHYPFTNCTHCGPRFSIIQALPYDRANTTMSGFGMCDECRAEYENPLDRRFHAQPNACPRCGPQLALWNRRGETMDAYYDALLTAARALRQGYIIALKGLGGFQLMVDARNPDALNRLRRRKGRCEKPFAVMMPTIEQVEQVCEVSEVERRLLQSAAAPIVLLHHTGSEMAPQVAPENPYLGVMLPYTPLHHLLMAELGFPVVATSGNRSDEPIVTDNYEALAKLGSIADVFLIHNRPIARHMDDSVVFTAEGEVVTLRRARGYAPQPIDIHPSRTQAGQQATATLIATGAHQKDTVALLHNGHVFLSQHLGDMDNPETLDLFHRELADFQTLYEAKPCTVACDLHPDYATTRAAEDSGLPLIRVQHHYAHVLSCMAEHRLESPVLGVAWDGTGYGTDGTIWGGEFLLVGASSFARVAWLRPFRLPGGDLAAREPRRSALGILYEFYGENLPRERLEFTARELNLLIPALERQINAPLTSSMGRLFDAVAALTGLRQRCSFEGQAAMALEFAGNQVKTDECYPFEITPVTGDGGVGGRMIEWKPMLAAILQETDVQVISAKFHNTVAAIIVAVAQQIREPVVVLTGGCFQNRMLLGKSIQGLRKAGFSPYWHQHIPSNDGGIALGQIAGALREISHVSSRSGKVDEH